MMTLIKLIAMALTILFFISICAAASIVIVGVIEWLRSINQDNNVEENS